MKYAIRIESASFPGRKCYLYKNARGFIDRHLNRASLWNSRASAIMAIELYRREIKNGTVSNESDLDHRVRFAEIVLKDEIEGGSLVIFENYHEKTAFSVGDIVKVKPNVHDAQMPKSDRTGHVVQVVGRRRDQALIMFSNDNVLKFHFCQIEKIKKSLQNAK